MNVISAIARRYLFAHKGTHFINIISGVTIFGLSVGSAALILVLSVFNGFEELIASMINSFNPDLKVIPVSGKFFDDDTLLVEDLYQIEGVVEVSRTIEETAIFEYDRLPTPGTMKGVDAAFENVSDIDSSMIEGPFLLRDEKADYAVLGSGVARNLSVDVLNVFQGLSIHMPDRKASNTARPYRTKILRPSGVFSVQQDIDLEYVIIPLDVAQSLLGRYGQISGLEIKIDETQNDLSSIENAVQERVGQNLDVQTLYEQDEEFLKLMNIEKWMAYLITSLMLLLITFNLIGCLWMIVLDKKQDIAILKAMGSTANFVRKVFLRLGMYFTGGGLLIGIFLAVLLYFLQKQFGLITIGPGFVVDTYPILMKVSDVLIVSITVLVIGFLASIPAANRASRLGSYIRET